MTVGMVKSLYPRRSKNDIPSLACSSFPTKLIGMGSSSMFFSDSSHLQRNYFSRFKPTFRRASVVGNKLVEQYAGTHAFFAQPISSRANCCHVGRRGLLLYAEFGERATTNYRSIFRNRPRLVCYGKHSETDRSFQLKQSRTRITIIVSSTGANPRRESRHAQQCTPSASVIGF